MTYHSLESTNNNSPNKLSRHSKNKKSESIKNSEVLQVIYMQEDEKIIIPEIDSFQDRESTFEIEYIEIKNTKNNNNNNMMMNKCELSNEMFNSEKYNERT